MPYKDKKMRNKHRAENKDRFNQQARDGYERRIEIRKKQARKHYHTKEKFNRIKLRNELYELLGGKK